MKTTFRCPSNIALVKYWGKKEGGIQLPANASISLTLSDLCAETTVEVTEPNSSGKASFEFLFNGLKYNNNFINLIFTFTRIDKHLRNIL